ncbi:MAG: hypothetical protein JNL36_02675 [Candidatus Kapabacteria bacterium]|nr:hypothetical protein [Candidatus Kapabacteria bacterium]
MKHLPAFLLALLVFIATDTNGYSFKNSQIQTKSKNNSSKSSYTARVCTPNESKQVIALHNSFRTPLSIPPITYSENLAQFALEWCKELGRKNGAFEHRPRTGPFGHKYGENIYKGTKTNQPFTDAVNLWSTEKSKFRNDILNRSNWSKAGHYSQMIWRKSVSVGCAVVEINGMSIVVCNYDPAGNMMGERTY